MQFVQTLISLFAGSLVALVLLVAYKKTQSSNLYKKLHSLFPSPPGPVSIIKGHFDVSKYPENKWAHMIHEWFNSTKSDTLSVMRGPMPIVCTRSTETMQAVLVKEDITNYSKGGFYQDLRPWLGEGILLSEGETWRHKRKLMNHGFSSNALKEMIPIFSKCTDVLLRHLDALPDGSEVDMLDLLTKTTLDIIGIAAFNFHFDALIHPTEETRAFETILREITTRVRKWILLPQWAWLNLTESGRNYQRSIDTLHRAAENIIKKRLNQRSDKASTKEDGAHKDLLDYIIDACLEENGDHKKISMNLLRDEIMTFLFAGHDTTSTAMTWFLAAMSQNREEEEKVLKEIDAVLTDEIPSINDIGKLTYTTMCFKESMRLNPSVRGVSRTTTTETIINGKKVPKGVNILLSIAGQQRNPTVIPDADKFNPLNFDPSSPQYAVITQNYSPFSLGPRNCIGQQFAMVEARTVLGKLYKKYTFKVVNPEKCYPILGVIAKPKDGLKVTIHRRS